MVPEPPRIVTLRVAKRGSAGVPVAKCEAAGDTQSAQEMTMRRKSFNFESPNSPKTHPSPLHPLQKSIQKASWSPCWANVLKWYDLESPTNNQNAPKSDPKTFQSVPNPSQMEPKTLPNQIFEQFLHLFFSGRKFASFFCSVVAEFVCFCKSRPLKFMRPRSVSLTSIRFSIFWKKYQKSSENLLETCPKSRKNQKKIENKWKQIDEKAKMSEENQEMRYRYEKMPR